MNPVGALFSEKMMSIDRFASRFGTAGNSGEDRSSLSQGQLLRQLEMLINEARQKVKTFEEGRTDHIGYVRKFRNRIQHCLLDIGQLAQDELHQIATLDLSISGGLQRYYDARVFNDFDVKDGDPSDFLRLQREYDHAMPSKIQRMITLMVQARYKMLNPAPAAEARTPHSPYSQSDDELYKRIGAENFKTMTNAELWNRYHRSLKVGESDLASFRSRADRVRRHHGFPLSSELRKQFK